MGSAPSPPCRGAYADDARVDSPRPTTTQSSLPPSRPREDRPPTEEPEPWCSAMSQEAPLPPLRTTMTPSTSALATTYLLHFECYMCPSGGRASPYLVCCGLVRFRFPSPCLRTVLLLSTERPTASAFRDAVRHEGRATGRRSLNKRAALPLTGGRGVASFRFRVGTAARRGHKGR